MRASRATFELHHQQAKSRAAVAWGEEVSGPPPGTGGASALWATRQDAAHSDGYHLPESSDFLVGDATFGDAILDRLVHRAHRVTLAGGLAPPTTSLDGINEPTAHTTTASSSTT